MNVDDNDNDEVWGDDELPPLIGDGGSDRENKVETPS